MILSIYIHIKYQLVLDHWTKRNLTFWLERSLKPDMTCKYYSLWHFLESLLERSKCTKFTTILFLIISLKCWHFTTIGSDATKISGKPYFLPCQQTRLIYSLYTGMTIWEWRHSNMPCAFRQILRHPQWKWKRKGKELRGNCWTLKW